MAVRSGPYDFIPYETELIRLPESSRLYFMPHTHPIAYDENKANMVEYKEGLCCKCIFISWFFKAFFASL